MKKNHSTIKKQLFLILFICSCVSHAGTSGKLFVAAEGTNNVVVINANTNTVITNIDVGSGTSPHNPVVSPDGNSVWVTLKGAGSVAKIDVATNTLVGTYSTGGASPVHMDFSIDGSSLYIVNQGSDHVVQMNTSTGLIANTYSFGSGPLVTPHDVNVAADGTVWVTDETANAVSVLDASLTGVNSTISVGDRPIQIVFDNNNNYAYTTNYDSNTVSVIDMSLLSTIDSFLMSNSGSMGPMGAVIEPDGTGLWLSGTAGNTVHRHSLVPGDNYSALEIPDLIGAHGLDISADGNFVYTSIYFDGSSSGRDAIAVLDANTGLLIDKFYTPGAIGLHGLVFVSTVPVPASIWLFGSGLLGLLGFMKKKQE